MTPDASPSFRRSRFLALASAGMSAAALAPLHVAPAAADPIVMKMGTATLNDMQHEFLKRYAVAIDKATNGRITAQVYPASQLGSIPREIEATQFGSIQCWVGPPEFLAGVDARYEVLSAPNIWKDIPHCARTLDDPQFSAAFLGMGADKGLKGLALFPHGPTAFDTRKPVNTVDDLKGLKIRVLAAQLQMEQISRVGATPVAMPLDQVLPALQQGAIDGAFTDLPVYTSLHYADAAKYVFESDQSMLTSIAVISKQWYDGLPPDLQKTVLDTGAKVARDLLPWIVQFNADQHKLWAEQGGQIVTPTAAQKADLTAKMAGIADDVLKDKPQVRAMYDLAMAAAKRTAR